MKKFIIITIIVLIYAIPLSFPKVRNSIKGKIENIYLNLKYPYQVETDFSKADFASQDELKKIDNDVQKCLDTNYETDYDMMQCSLKGIEKYKIEINRSLEAAKYLISKKQYHLLLNSQKEWEKYRQKEDKFLKEAYEKNCLSYLPCLIAVGDKYHSFKNRAENLSGFCGIWILFKEKGILDDDLNFVPFSN